MKDVIKFAGILVLSIIIGGVVLYGLYSLHEERVRVSALETATATNTQGIQQIAAFLNDQISKSQSAAK